MPGYADADDADAGDDVKVNWYSYLLVNCIKEFINKLIFQINKFSSFYHFPNKYL